MKQILFALQFLTIIPVKLKKFEDKYIAGSMVYFPFIGLFLGLILAGANNLMTVMKLEELSISIILAVLLVILTGGIHLDGLADTADAFLSRKNKDEMLAIMRDSHIGVMGVVSLISILLLKIAFIYSLAPGLRNPSLLLMCVLSRFSLVLAMEISPYARKEGKAKIFFEGADTKILFLSALMAFVLAIAISGIKGLTLMALTAALTFFIVRLVIRKIGGITGDTLGALCEIMEVVVLSGALLLKGVSL